MLLSLAERRKTASIALSGRRRWRNSRRAAEKSTTRSRVQIVERTLHRISRWRNHGDRAFRDQQKMVCGDRTRWRDNLRAFAKR